MAETKQEEEPKTLDHNKWYKKPWVIVLATALGVIVLLIIFTSHKQTDTTNQTTESTQPLSAEEQVKADAEHNAQVAKNAEAVKQAAQTKLANLKATAENIPYKTLYRNIADYKGKSVHYQGEVIQIMQDTVGGSSLIQMRVNVTKGEYGLWEDTVLVTELVTADTPAHPKILEKDIIDFWGTVSGEQSYTSTMGATISLPGINAEIIELMK